MRPNPLMATRMGIAPTLRPASSSHIRIDYQPRLREIPDAAWTQVASVSGWPIIQSSPAITARRVPPRSGSGRGWPQSCTSRCCSCPRYDFEPVALTPGVIPTSFNDRRLDAAQAQIDRARKLVPDAVDLREDVVPAEGVTEALADVAREADACLLTVGRDVDGQVARTLLQRSPCPLAVAPSSVTASPDEPLCTIGVAWDGSPGARFALQAAMHLALRTGAAVQIISVGPASTPTQPPRGCQRPWRSTSSSWTVIRGGASSRPARSSTSCCAARTVADACSAPCWEASPRTSSHAAQCPVLVVPLRVRSRATAPLGLTTAAG